MNIIRLKLYYLFLIIILIFTTISSGQQSSSKQRNLQTAPTQVPTQPSQVDQKPAVQPSDSVKPDQNVQPAEGQKTPQAGQNGTILTTNPPDRPSAVGTTTKTDQPPEKTPLPEKDGSSSQDSHQILPPETINKNDLITHTHQSLLPIDTKIESGPTENSSLPPLTPKNTDEILKLNIPNLSRLLEVIKSLPPTLQNLIAECAKQNNDQNRAFDVDCFINKFNDVKIQAAQATASDLTYNSKNTRNGLTCLTRVTQNFAESTDSVTTSIEKSVSTVASQQTTLNNCKAKFTKFMIELFNKRLRFLCTTKNNIDITSNTNSEGKITSFVFTEEEQKSTVEQFKIYANCLYSFTNTFSSKVLESQALVGNLTKCKLQSTAEQTSSTAQSGQLFQTMSNNDISFKIPDEFKTFITENQKIYQTKGLAQWNTLAQKLNNLININSGYQQQSFLTEIILRKMENSGWLKQEFDKTIKQESCSGDYIFYCTLGTCTCTDSLCPQNISGIKYFSMIKENIKINNSNDTSASGKGRILQQTTQPANPPTTNATNPGSSTLNTSTTTTSSANTSTTTTSAATSSTTTTITTNTISPPIPTTAPTLINNPPKDPASTTTNSITGPSPSTPILIIDPPPLPEKPIDSTIIYPRGPTEQQSGQKDIQTKPGVIQPIIFISQTDDIKSLYISGGCINSKRFIYSEAIFNMSGNKVDYINSDSTEKSNMGKQRADQMNNCTTKLSTGSETEKNQCRGPMNEVCSKALDNICKNTGLIKGLTNFPSSSSPYPKDCNETNQNYSEKGCFNWIINNLTKNSIVFDHREMETLSMRIDESYRQNNSSRILRYLQYDVKVVSSDPTKEDTQASRITSQATINDSDMTIDSATATSVPSANIYINELNTQTKDLNSLFIQLHMALLIIIFGLII